MKKTIAGYFATCVVAALVAAAAHLHVVQGVGVLTSEYIAKSRAEAQRGAQDVDHDLQTIYQSLRTLASLPGVRSIDRHAANISVEARTTFQMIYNNLANSVSVSEVYVVPADFDPDRVDPVTLKPEAPIIMFDELILNAGAAISAEKRASNPELVAQATPTGPPEVETHEYKLLEEQAAWFRSHYPDNSKISGLNVPIISGADVITCDNTYFISSMDDADRKGMVFSVPFYDERGVFKGMVAAIILNRALGGLLPGTDFALVNPQYGIVATKAPVPPHVEKAIDHIRQGLAEPGLLFSQVQKISLNDPQSPWLVWTGYDDAQFYQGSEYLALQHLRLYGFALAAIVLLAGCLATFLADRDARHSATAARHLAHARDEARKAEGEARDLADKFQQLNADIGRLNRELTGKVSMLQEAQEEIVKRGKLAQLGQLTATVAHELRNPMGSVQTTAFLMRRKAGYALPALVPLLERIDNGIRRCDDIITRLLDFTHSKEPVLLETGLDQWLSDTVEVETHALPGNVAVACELGLGGLRVSMDPGGMRRAIVNLMTNASEALVGKAGMPVPRSAGHPLIRVTTQRSARGIEISVEDNGPGMDADTIARVREPLFTTKNFGVGLGIPAAERIIELHGGGLEISSTPGKGSTFTLWLPAETPGEAKAA